MVATRSNLEDEELGYFTLVNKKEKAIWKGASNILQTNVTTFVSGTKTHLDDSERANLLSLINSADIELEMDKALKEEFENADKKYLTWKDHFDCISVSTLNNETIITFEEKDSLSHFNVFVQNGKAVGISIDS